MFEQPPAWVRALRLIGRPSSSAAKSGLFPCRAFRRIGSRAGRGSTYLLARHHPDGRAAMEMTLLGEKVPRAKPWPWAWSIRVCRRRPPDDTAKQLAQATCEASTQALALTRKKLVLGCLRWDFPWGASR